MNGSEKSAMFRFNYLFKKSQKVVSYSGLSFQFENLQRNCHVITHKRPTAQTEYFVCFFGEKLHDKHQKAVSESYLYAFIQIFNRVSEKHSLAKITVFFCNQYITLLVVGNL